MGIRAYCRALIVGGVGLLLAGCSGSSTGVTAPPATAAASVRRSAGTSGDLVYVSTSTAVKVLSYPGLKVVQSLPSSYSYSGICSDPNNGNVYVAAATQVIVYAHGGTTPIATLTPPSGYHSLVACAVDPTTDNLVVSSQYEYSYKKAALLLYHEGQGTPTIIAPKQLDWYWYPTYDGNGNLFVTCWTKHGRFHIDELPVGKTQFISIKVVRCCSVGKIQWDGTYIAFEEYYGQGASKVFQMQVSGSVGTIVGAETYAEVGDLSNFWIHDGVLFNALGKIKSKNNRGIGAWAYPAGGDPTASGYGLTNGANDKIIDLTVSVSPSRK
jgi:hypothetical protein